ncbi:hypothetical protein [Nitrobacter sp. TKz-YC02]|uniref:hypothetical protein n=1 Tax=Nitrobacter sp. TKz-YC02 TaxID=3398704 RepID=UPI003CEF7575
MGLHIRVNRDKTYQERLDEEAQRLLEEAEKSPSEAYRDLLMRRVSQIEAATRRDRWLASPELRRPT